MKLWKSLRVISFILFAIMVIGAITMVWELITLENILIYDALLTPALLALTGWCFLFCTNKFRKISGQERFKIPTGAYICIGIFLFTLGGSLLYSSLNNKRLGDGPCRIGYFDGPCVPNRFSDVDCYEVGGPVRVLYEDDDVYNLDNDGDGIGCEEN